MPPEEIIVLGVCSYLGLGLGNINWHRFQKQKTKNKKGDDGKTPKASNSE